MRVIEADSHREHQPAALAVQSGRSPGEFTGEPNEGLLQTRRGHDLAELQIEKHQPPRAVRQVDLATGLDS